MRWNKFSPLQILLFSTAFLIFAYLYFSHARAYPYYFMWDMDQTTAIDALLLQGGEIPVHINHPAFGMYFVLHWAHKIALAFGQISFSDLEDVRTALNPIAGYAELITHLRGVSPMIVLAGIGALWCAFTGLTAAPFGLALVFLVTLGTQSSLFYHVTMIRSEIYAVVFWSIAVLFLALGAKNETENRSSKSFYYILLAGFFLGLSYLTKLQAIFYIISAPLLFLAFQLSSGRSVVEISEKRRKLLSAGNFTWYVFLLIAAHFRYAEGATFATAYPLNIIAIFFLVVIGALFLLERLKKPFASELAKRCSFLHILFSGFFLSFLTHFFVLGSLRHSYKYMLLDAKMLFFRMNYYQNYTVDIAMNWVWPNFLAMLSLVPVTAFVHISFAVLVLYFRRSKKAFLIVGALVGLSFLNFALGTRGVLRDLLWAEVLMNIVTLSFAVNAWHELKKWKMGLGVVVMVFPLLVLITSQIASSSKMLTRVDAQYNHYGWKQARFFDPIYGESQLVFGKIMSEKYGSGLEAREIAVKHAMHFSEIKRAVQFTFPNQKADFRYIGILENKFPVWAGSRSRLYKVPDALRGAVLVDNLGLPTLDFIFNAGTVINDLDGLDKFAQVSKKDTLAVLTREDLNVYLFLPTEEFTSIAGRSPAAKDISVVIRNDDKSLKSLYAMTIENYREIPKVKLEGKAFFALVQKPRGFTF